MKFIMVSLMTLFLSSCASSGLGLINLFAKSNNYNVNKDISYGEHEQNLLDVYLPTKMKPTTTVLFFYGGCWGHCSDLDKHHYLFVAEALTQMGVAVVIPDYRKYPDVKFSEIMKDAKNAAIWTMKNIKDFGLENTNIFVMGHSSGAHMAALLAVNDQYLGGSLSNINGMIGLAGPYDFYPFNSDYMYKLFSEDDYAKSQPINFIDGDEPPFLILQGDKENKVYPKNAINLSAKLTKYQVEHELLMLDQKRHSAVLLNLAKPFRRDKKVLLVIKGFINKYK